MRISDWSSDVCSSDLGSFKSLKKRLESAGETEIDQFVSDVRNAMYKRIDADISNDELKTAFRDTIDAQQKQLRKRLPAALGTETERLQQAPEDILASLEAQYRELTGQPAPKRNNQQNNQK